MKISTETLQILKNYASINTGMLFTPGNMLRTRTDSVFAEARVDEEFPSEHGIFDLSNMLNVVALFKDAELDFQPAGLVIRESDGSAESMYGYAGAATVTLEFPKKMKPLPPKVITFRITEDQWSKLQKATSILQKPEVKLTSDGKVVRIGTASVKNEKGNSFSMVLDGDPQGLKCKMVFSKEHLNFLKGNYDGTVTPTYTMFKNASGFDLTYYIGIEPSASSFGE